MAREPFLLVCRRDLPIAASAHLTWAQLQGVPLVRISAETGNRILVDDALGARRETLTWRYEAQRITTAVSLARSGAAAVIVPQLAHDVADAPEWSRFPLHAPTVTRTLGIVTRKGALITPPAQALMALMAEALKARLGRVDAAREA